MDIEFVEELAKLLERSAASEIEVEVGDLHVRLKKGAATGRPEPPPAQGEAPAEGPREEAERVQVRSPYVGLFRPAVSEGQEVGEGEVICYIEVVGVPSEVTSPTAGRVASLPLKEGEPVEYGQVVAELEPISPRGEESEGERG